jgi:hypothetical protein
MLLMRAQSPAVSKEGNESLIINRCCYQGPFANIAGMLLQGQLELHVVLQAV